MVNQSRIDIYDYLYNLIYGVISENVYDMNVPQELTESDTKDGFIVIHVGTMVDESEFDCQAYSRVRCYIEAFVPSISRGRVNRDIYVTARRCSRRTESFWQSSDTRTTSSTGSWPII